MSADDKRAPVLVVGGGIGGLGAALALSRKGIAVHVIEQAPEFKEIGAGIQLGPNVFRMFDYLGLTEEMNKWAEFPLGLEMRDAIAGQTFAELPVDHRFYERYHAPYAVIHRADMLNVIYEACKRSKLVQLTPSQKVVGFDETASGLRARTECGKAFSGAALIGCGGLWSTVRQLVVGDGKPVVSGHIAYRAVVSTPEWPKEYRINKICCGPFGGIVVCEDRDLIVEEAPEAYKRIDRVIADLTDFGLARVVATFRPLVTFKTALAGSKPRVYRAGREDRR